MSPTRWALVLPVKRLAVAKTRLGPPYADHRPALALAFAVDTAVAALACPAVATVQVVTDEPAAARELAGVGALVTADHPGAGLNPALAHGAAEAALAFPSTYVGTLAADLPALRPSELATVLDAAAEHPRAFVRDAAGTGTTLLTARDPAALAPMFGPASADRHLTSGAVEVCVAGVLSVRRDVDTVADLLAAAALGVGARTGQLLDDLGIHARAG